MALAITSFTPTSASSLGGDQVTITGTSLDTADVVLVGAKVAQILSQTATQIVVKVPAQAAGSLRLFAVDNDSDTEVQSTGTLTVVASSATRGALTGAAKVAVQIDLSAAQDGSGYVPIRALTNVVPGFDTSSQDTSNYDDYDPTTNAVWGSEQNTKFMWSLQLTFDRNKYANAYDPGQQKIWFAHDKVGANGQVRVRWFDRTGGPEAYEGFATVTWGDQGGATDAKASTQCTLKGLGARMSITNPVISGS